MRQREILNAAKEKAAGVDRSKYTDESLKALDDAVAAVVEGLKKSEQSRVDAMAAAINNAYAALVEKEAEDPAEKEATGNAEPPEGYKRGQILFLYLTSIKAGRMKFSPVMKILYSN